MKRTLTAIEAELWDGYIVIPKGMKPVFLHDQGNRLLAYVLDWSPSGEYDATYFDLYLLSAATRFVLPCVVNGERSDQTWYGAFGEYNKEALKTADGLRVRDRQT